eukprot:scaffold9439_cov115-Cylindrotheca_fusiformis.AAC.10
MGMVVASLSLDQVVSFPVSWLMFLPEANYRKVHDPDSPGGGVGKPATLGNLEGFERDGRFFEMIDGGAYNGDKGKQSTSVAFPPPTDTNENLKPPPPVVEAAYKDSKFVRSLMPSILVVQHYVHSRVAAPAPGR